MSLWTSEAGAFPPKPSAESLEAGPLGNTRAAGRSWNPNSEKEANRYEAAFGRLRQAVWPLARFALRLSRDTIYYQMRNKFCNPLDARFSYSRSSDLQSILIAEEKY